MTMTEHEVDKVTIYESLKTDSSYIEVILYCSAPICCTQNSSHVTLVIDTRGLYHRAALAGKPKSEVSWDCQKQVLLYIKMRTL
jgi:hypothetical protein